MDTQETDTTEELEALERSTAERESALTEGFLGSGPAKIAGFTLRPFAFGSLTVCRSLKLSLFTGEDGDELTEAETIDQLCAFLWIQSQPVKEVLKAVNDGTAAAVIAEFQFEVPLHALPDIMKQVTAMSKMASDAAVDVVPKPDTGESGAPKN